MADVAGIPFRRDSGNTAISQAAAMMFRLAEMTWAGEVERLEKEFADIKA